MAHNEGSFIHVQFNFTLSYITLSLRGRVSHPILHLGRVKYAPKQSPPPSVLGLLKINANQAEFYPQRDVKVKREKLWFESQ